VGPMSFYWNGSNISSGDEWSNGFAFAALKADGSVVTWGDPDFGGNSSGLDFSAGVDTIFSNVFAFAALMLDGSVVTWGLGISGGDSSAVADQLSSGVVDIFSTGAAFAALKDDGSVVTWGEGSSGGNSSAVAAQLSGDVVRVFSTGSAFAALKADGTVVTWGDPDYGGVSTGVDFSGGIATIHSNTTAFAAIKADGSVVTWGNPDAGGNSSEVSIDLTDVCSITSTTAAFAAMKADGSVVTWGDTYYGGDSTSVAAALSSGIVQIYANEGAFAAVKDDGSVITWGHGPGGDSSAVAAALSCGVVTIYSTQGAFAALKDDGSVVTWGDSGQGGDSAAVAADLSGGVYAIYSTGQAFAALKIDGSVVTWGNGAAGGDSSAVQPELCGCVYTIYSTSGAFAALMMDGRVVTWGESDRGGDSSGVASELGSGVVVLNTVDDCAPPPLCYARGTMILTDRGERPIETLRAGDMVATLGGGFRAIRWIGEQRYEARVVPPGAAPILIRAGALGEGIPRRDLRVAPFHSMLVDGRLVYAERLVNGVTILREPPPRELHYYQLDLGGHDCVLAEGAWSESYADFPGGRAAFDNAADHARRFPDHVPPPEVVLCYPRPERGPELEIVLRPIAARASAAAEAPGPLAGAVDRIVAAAPDAWRVSGWALDPSCPDMPQRLDVVLDGEVIGTVLACDYRWDLARAGLRRGWCSFAFRVAGTITTAQAMRLEVRRSADDRSLAKTPACIEGILGVPANTDGLGDGVRIAV